MLQLVAFIIFIVSLVALAVLLGRKIPVLVQLPQNGHHGFKKPELIARIQQKIKAKHFHLFEKRMLMHKILSTVKVLTLKIEQRVDAILHGIRKNAQELDKQTKKGK